jgi:hypothetical protein
MGALVLMLALPGVASVASSVAAAATPSTSGGSVALTAVSLAGATLPAGTCVGDPNQATHPIQLSHGYGHLGTDNPFPSVDYVGAGLVGKPVSVNFGGKGHAGVAAIIECGEGGSFEASSVWVFTGSPSKLKVLFGPLFPRTYDVTSSAFGSQVTSVKTRGHALVVGDMFSRPVDACGSCGTGRASTTWALSPGHPSHLVIVQPRSVRVRVLKSVSPAGWDGGTTTRNQRGPRLVRGHMVSVLCTIGGRAAGGETLLVTGAWVPGTDVASSRLPDCDKLATSAAPLKTTAAPTTTSISTSAPVTTTTAPPPSTTTPVAPSGSALTLSGLEAAIAQQDNAVPPSPGQPPGSWTVTCGPPSASLAVGSLVACGQINPAIGVSTLVVQITGDTPSSFTIVLGPGSAVCQSADPGQLVALQADGQCTS